MVQVVYLIINNIGYFMKRKIMSIHCHAELFSHSIPLSLPIMFPFILTFDPYISLAKFFSPSILLSLVSSQTYVAGDGEHSSGRIW